jgi:hypothetical protein
VSALLAFCSLSAQTSNSAYNFLDVTSSSHVYGLGGVNVSLIDDDVNIIEQNPGLLGPEHKNQLGVNYMRYIGGSNFAGVTYANAINDRSAWAASLRYFGYGEMKGADELGNLTGTFSPKDMYFSGTFAHDMAERWRGGITVKAVYSSYDIYTAWALATDLGVNYFDADKDLSLSAVVTNLGGQVKRFNTTYDRLPVDIRLGLTKGFLDTPFRVSVTAYNLTKWHLPYLEAGDGSSTAEMEVKDSFCSNLFRHLVFAAEYVPSSNFYFGVGYNYKTRTDMSTYSRSFLSGLSACAGLNVSHFSVGIAFAQPHNSASTFMVNLSMRLSDL